MALLPIAATLAYYVLPASLQAQTPAQFAPQLLAYLALTLWAAQNHPAISRLGLDTAGLRNGLRWGLLVGIMLGASNALVILKIVPALGYDLTFLQDTPHAHIPLAIMMPWFICGIALFVEVNFRGFVLGRLAMLESRVWKSGLAACPSPLALIVSALVFAFDPFMVNTFRHLHWIALWDGMIWGMIWLRTRNLYSTIVAHAVEVIVLYLAVRTALS
ncbi:type II CAAX prenyl endopeptidase Rce1 family protein [Nitrospira sp. NS4]|uniref:CPBP family glutamic-type intramembrane protease n=1 Tax=Nitrospira sp. NS4 TaxID=3414498 RepID=UPI003C2C8BA9